MATTTAKQPAANLTFQGIVVPGSALNPKAFFAATRRQRVLQQTWGTWQGWGNSNETTTLRAGILSGFFLTISGTLHLTPGSGTVHSTAAWPYGLIRNLRFQANGQSNLVSADGWFLRAREFMSNPELNDRGVANGIGGSSPGTSRTQGTLALASETWGVGSNVSGIASGSYDVQLSVYVPVAYELKMLTGAIFAQTMSTTLELVVTWANLSTLFTLTTNAAVTFTPRVVVEAEMFTIPASPTGGMLLPNLSAFHSFVQSKAPNDISANANTVFLAGQGVGRQLMKVVWRTLNGSKATPVIPNATAVTGVSWGFGTNTFPEAWTNGRVLRAANERSYGVDIARYAGFECIDFDETWAFRDSVNEGSATTIRFRYTLSTGLTLSSPACQYAQDTILAGAAA